MKRFLLDTNICIYFLNGQYDLNTKFKKIGFENCAISEITIAELKYGVEKSLKKEKNLKTLKSFEELIEIIPIYPSLDIYAQQKAKLKTKGKSLDDFDLLIGSTAIFNNLTLVTKNTSDFERMEGLILMDWTVN